MDYTPHICDPAGFECTGGGDNIHVCESDSIHQRACKTCAKYPTDPELLKILAKEHAGYPNCERTINYRDRRCEPQSCQCSIADLMTKGHRKGCPKN